MTSQLPYNDVILRKSYKFLKDQQYHQYYSNQPVYYQPMQGMSHNSLWHDSSIT